MRILALGLLVAAALAASPALAGPEAPIRVVEGAETRSLAAEEVGGALYVTLADLAAVLGGEVVRDREADTEVYLLGENRIEIPGETTLVLVNGEVQTLPVPVVAGPRGLRVPIDFVLTVVRPLYPKGLVWSAEERTLLVTKDRPVEVDLEVSFSEQGARAVLRFSRRVPFELEPEGRRLVVRLAAPEIRVPFASREYGEPSLRRVRFHRTPQGGQITLQAGRGFERWRHQVEEGPFRLVIEVTGTSDLLAGEDLEPQAPVRERSAPAPPAAPSPATPEPSPPARPDGRWIVVLDPGHGGSETGATGPEGMYEKDLVLDVCLRLRRLLQSDPSVRVILTRESDLDLGLEDRTALANHHGADLFLSIHANASDWREASGAETYFLSPSASDDEARRTAAMENKALGLGSASGPGGRDLRLILWDLAQAEFLEESSDLAESIQNELNRVLGIENRGIKQAPFRVLTGATMPAVLVEIGFLSNPREETLFRQAEYKEKVAAAIQRSILQFRRDLEARTGGAPGARNGS